MNQNHPLKLSKLCPVYAVVTLIVSGIPNTLTLIGFRFGLSDVFLIHAAAQRDDLICEICRFKPCSQRSFSGFFT